MGEKIKFGLEVHGYVTSYSIDNMSMPPPEPVMVMWPGRFVAEEQIPNLCLEIINNSSLFVKVVENHPTCCDCASQRILNQVNLDPNDHLYCGECGSDNIADSPLAALKQKIKSTHIIDEDDDS